MTDRETLLRLKEYLTCEQGVSPAMTDALETANACRGLSYLTGDEATRENITTLADYIEALREQVAAAWQALDNHADGKEVTL